MTDHELDTIAAVDLGSNSFHMIVARLQDGQLGVVDRLREPVRLADGLTDDNRLSDDVRERAIACLQRFGQRLNGLPPGSVRAVGTNTLRRAQRAGGFLDDAQQALGHPIEIISGVEEARLIYEGVSHSIALSGERRFVMDIGGGSTELIVGEGAHTNELESLYMGCVSYSRRFFPNGHISKAAFKSALLAARLELKPVQARFRVLGWEMATGASGTIKAIREIVQQSGWSEQGITWASLKKLRKALLSVEHVDQLKLAGLSDDRRPVLPGGFAILYATFEALAIDTMNVSQGALREGLLYDLVGRIQHHDVREASVEAMATRYHIDGPHAARVEALARQLFEAVRTDWGLSDDNDWPWLKWAARLHEIGLVIAHSGYHKHGAYVLENADMAGFSMREQAFLGMMVRAHRRKFNNALWKNLPSNQVVTAMRLCVLLRLAVLLRRERTEEELPALALTVTESTVAIDFPDGWLAEHPLTQGDLEVEAGYLDPDFSLTFS